MKKLTEKQAYILRAMRVNDFELESHSSDNVYMAGTFLIKGNHAEDVSRAVANKLEDLKLIERIPLTNKEYFKGPPNWVRWRITDKGKEAT